MQYTGTLIQKVIKRSGEAVAFDAQKITNAIAKAGKASGEFERETAEALTQQVAAMLEEICDESGVIPDIESIQDIVEQVLFASRYKKTARAYIIYRDQHARLREFMAERTVHLVDAYLEREDWQVNENSNMSFSLQGLNNYISSEISKTYWLHNIYPEELRHAHTDGDLHLHDLGSLSAYCVGWDLYDLLRKGFRGVAGKVEAGPAKHFRSALGQIVNFFYTLQGEAAGAQAFANFDTLLAPFIRSDKLSYTEVRQAMQEFMFNVNVPTRVGFQTPFTNITLDLTVPSYYKDQPVLIGGKPTSSTYSEFQNEMDMLNTAFLEVMAGGDARGRVFTFPIPTYNISEDFDWNNPHIEKLWEVTAKYGIPYFANFVNSDMKPEDARSMCCRLRIDNRELNRRGGGLFGASPLTGSIGVVTINLPRIGYLAENEEDFISRLDRLMCLAAESLDIKRKVLEKFTDNRLYPYMQYYLRDVKKRFGKYWQNHFSTIGIIGMNEACLNLLGCDITTPGGNAFALRVMDYMRARLVDFQKESGNIFNLEATPAEGTSYRLALLDQKKYPDLVHASREEVSPFYTNSSQPPVNYTDDLFDLLDMQDELQKRYTGGTVVHLFAGERLSDPKAVRELVRTVCARYHLPYFSITPTFSICPQHGYIDGEHAECPECHSDCEIYSRVVGYLRPVKQWNNGKQSEFTQRRMLRLEAARPQ
ncbi:MAG: ribonucleoside triphosphate reductase [Spirochaetota bacterium]|jgi:ribonucleoside-triphosphate reductase|nr:ribonucleoside triphosphate reductase [Spirochaetota bacterium]